MYARIRLALTGGVLGCLIGLMSTIWLYDDFGWWMPVVVCGVLAMSGSFIFGDLFVDWLKDTWWRT